MYIWNMNWLKPIHNIYFFNFTLDLVSLNMKFILILFNNRVHFENTVDLDFGLMPLC